MERRFRPRPNFNRKSPVIPPKQGRRQLRTGKLLSPRFFLVQWCSCLRRGLPKNKRGCRECKMQECNSGKGHQSAQTITGRHHDYSSRSLSPEQHCSKLNAASSKLGMMTGLNFASLRCSPAGSDFRAWSSNRESLAAKMSPVVMMYPRR